jgi:hypothetical protein
VKISPSKSKALEDTLHVIQRFKEETDLSISVLITPTLIHHEGALKAMKKTGADRVGIAIDAATPELFDRLRGRGVGGPHRWDHYWDVVQMSVCLVIAALVSLLIFRLLQPYAFAGPGFFGIKPFLRYGISPFWHSIFSPVVQFNSSRVIYMVFL